MTETETAGVLRVIAAHWDGASLGEMKAAIRTWHAVLGRFDARDVQAAVERLLSREWPPRAGQVAAEVQSSLQGEPPPFEQVGVAVERAQHWLPYSPAGSYSSADTARAVAVLQARGAHEAVLRFVASLGLGAVLAIPWGERNPLDLNQSADRRDMARAYRQNTLAAWQRDPRPGRALERACQAAQLDQRELLEAAAAVQSGHRARLAAPAGRALLPAPADPEGDGEAVDLSEAIEAYRAGRALVLEQEAAERAEARAAGNEAYRAAEAELAAHAAQRSAVERVQ